MLDSDFSSRSISTIVLAAEASAIEDPRSPPAAAPIKLPTDDSASPFPIIFLKYSFVILIVSVKAEIGSVWIFVGFAFSKELSPIDFVDSIFIVGDKAEALEGVPGSFFINSLRYFSAAEIASGVSES